MRTLPGARSLCALAFASVLGPLGCAKIEARDLIREGNKAYNDGRFADAIAAYDKAETLEPDGVTLFWNRACAAEAQVLRLKEPETHAERRKYADMALRDFQTWYDRLDQKTEEDEKQLHDHRLALLDADERCNDLQAYWLEKHRANPKEEALYSVVARIYERCHDTGKADEWHVKRTEDFPDSVKAWHALAIRRFEPLWPDPEKQLPYNEAVPPAERLKVADEVIRLLDKATALDAKFRDAYVWRSMAYTQKQFARIVVDPAQTPEEKLEALLAREDSMAAWRQQKAVCDLEELKDCPGPTPETPCCPPPPLSPTEQAADVDAKKKIEEEIRLAEQGILPEDAGKKGKKGKKGKGK